MKRVLYLGIDPPKQPCNESWFHYPIIETEALPFSRGSIRNAFSHLSEYTHFIFTSKNAVRYFSEAIRYYSLNFPSHNFQEAICVGANTGACFHELGGISPRIASVETAEGVVQLLEESVQGEAFYFWPHAEKARSVISDYLKAHQIKHIECVLYVTHTRKNLPKIALEDFDEVFFTSPSTVDAFLETFGRIPSHLSIKTMGPITAAKIECMGQSSSLHR